MEATLEKLDTEKLEQEALTVREEVAAVQVNDKESYEYAGEMVLRLKSKIDQIKEFFREPKEHAYKAHKSITAREKALLDPVETELKSLTGKISAYLTEQERIRREEQARIDRENAERERQERARLQNEADQALNDGDEATAELLMEQAESVIVPAEVIAPEVQKTTRMESGMISQKKEIEVEVTDLLLLVKEIAAGRAPIGLVQAKEGEIKRWAKVNNLQKFPGLVIREKMAAAFRSK